MDIQVIENTITDLENAENTFENCSKLASLYIIREEVKKGNNAKIDGIVRELNDILPAYDYYIDRKRCYQLGQCDEDFVISSMSTLCFEISEFIQTLYSSTDMPKERNLIRNLISNLQEITEIR